MLSTEEELMYLECVKKLSADLQPLMLELMRTLNHADEVIRAIDDQLTNNRYRRFD